MYSLWYSAALLKVFYLSCRGPKSRGCKFVDGFSIVTHIRSIIYVKPLWRIFRQWTIFSLAEVIAYCLFGDKPLAEAKLTTSDTQEQENVKI